MSSASSARRPKASRSPRPFPIRVESTSCLLSPAWERPIGIAGPAARSRLHDFSGQLNIGELGALIERAAVLIGNNSGPVHLASALGTPVVDLYALTNPQHTPWQTEHRVLFRDVDCRWCYRSVCPKGHHACLLGVPAAEVAAAALELAAKRTASISDPDAVRSSATRSTAERVPSDL